jgi:N utilization substance protein B
MYEWEFTARKIPGHESDIKKIRSTVEPILRRNYQEFANSVENRQFIDQLVWGVIDNKPKIDAIIIPAAPEWPIEQIALVDLIVLRLGIYELLFAREVPPKVAINEAVELAKAFGGQNSSRFVNGVLGTVYRASDIYNPEDDKKVPKLSSEPRSVYPDRSIGETSEKEKKHGK